MVSIGGLITFGAGKAIIESKRKVPDDVLIGEFGDNDIVYKLGVPFIPLYRIHRKSAKLPLTC